MTGYRTAGGSEIALGQKLGQGGEGAVYRTADGDAVKIWRDGTDRRAAAQKIQVMLENPPDADRPGDGRTAWPKELVLDQSGRPAGFTMPLLDPARNSSVFNHFNPAARERAGLQNANADLFTIARNIALAFGRIHDRGHVVGDVNEMNTMVDRQGRVTLVDADSMQIRNPENGRTHRCAKGRDDYTPPRMQGKRFRDYDRTTDDDNFGIAVIIFKLLMNGVHPFASTADHESKENTSLASKIKLEYFPYNESGKTPAEHKPSIPYRNAWQELDFGLRHMFRRAFDPDSTEAGPRPTPGEWVKEMDPLILNPPKPKPKPRQKTGRGGRYPAPAANAGVPSSQAGATAGRSQPGIIAGGTPAGAGATAPAQQKPDTKETAISVAVGVAVTLVTLGALTLINRLVTG